MLGLSSQALFLEVITEKADGTYTPPIKISSLWKDADPGIPLLRQAKAECAKLQ